MLKSLQGTTKTIRGGGVNKRVLTTRLSYVRRHKKSLAEALLPHFLIVR